MPDQPQDTQKNKTSRMAILAITGAVIVIAGLVYVVFNLINPQNTTVNTGAAIVESDSVFDGGTPIDPPRLMEDFTLTSNTGEPISLSDLRGKITLLYFGYTHCPDFCPTTMGDFKQIKAALGDDADNVAFVMVSVDGERDKVEVLNSYLDAFDPAFIGMTGDQQTLQRIGVDYGLYFEKRAGDTADEYLVDHISSIYMIDPQGQWTMLYMYGTEPEVIVEDVQAMLS